LSAIFLPIFLIIGALSAILVVFGRHIPEIVRTLKERKKEKDLPEPIDELPVNPQVHQLLPPQRKSIAVVTAKIIPAGKFVLAKIVWAVKHVWPALKFVGQMLAKVFHRVPRVSPTLFSFKHGKDVETVDFPDATEQTPVVNTTTDIKVVEKNPLRYPEPMSDELVALTQPKKHQAIVQPRKGTRRRIVLEQEQEVGSIKNEEKIKVAKEETSSEVVMEEPQAISIKHTGETRTRNRRRIVGTVAPKIVTQIEQEKPEIKEEVVEDLVNPAPITPPSEKKISFLARGSYSLIDATEEISNQIEEGKYNVAESALIDVLSKNPRNTEAYRLLGIVYLKRKDYAQAREVFEEALRRDPEHKGLCGPLGLCYMSVGEYGRALSMYQQAHNMDETNIEHLEQLLIISSRMDRRPLVKMTAKKILALNPNHVEAKKILERVAVR
jgi:TolA-binding protein